MHRSAPALFPCFDRALISVCESLSAKIAVRALGVWKSSMPRSGKEWEAVLLMHSAVSAEAAGLVMRVVGLVLQVIPYGDSDGDSNGEMAACPLVRSWCWIFSSCLWVGLLLLDRPFQRSCCALCLLMSAYIFFELMLNTCFSGELW